SETWSCGCLSPRRRGVRARARRGAAPGPLRRIGRSAARPPRSCTCGRPWPCQSSLGGGGTFERVFALTSRMARIRIYSTRWCAYCVRAKALLDSRGYEYEEVSLDDDPAFRQKLFELTGGWTVPQILIDGTPIGGYTELW